MSEYPGTSAPELIGEIARELPLGAVMSFATVDYSPVIEARGRLSPKENLAIARSLHLRKTLGLPFWDGLLLAASTEDCKAGDGLLEAAAFHQVIGSKRVWLPTQEINGNRLNAMCVDAQREGRMLVVTSAVQLPDGPIQHLPMMDFHLAYSESSTELLTKLVLRWGFSGALLRSGKSYHFYGKRLFDETSLIRFLGRALLYSPIVDRAWIAHQLIEQSCALRVSPRHEYGGPPFIVARLG